MRVFLLFFTLGISLCFSNNSYSQSTKISLNLKNKTVKQLFSEIEKNSEFIFFYQDDIINVNRKVTVNANNETIEQILDEVLSATGNSYFVSDRSIYIVKDPSDNILRQEDVVQQQKKTISGIITDKEGVAVIGANVVEKGTTNGTVTDVNGRFSLSVESDAAIQISYIGYLSQEIPTAGKTTIDVVLQEDTQSLEELVVVGYGTQKKVNLTGSVAAVKVDETLSSRSLTNVASGLSGLLPGLAINQNSGMAGKNNISLVIRGLGTVNNTNPLIVVDGMPDVDLNRINMNDIESVSVLKDAASSAVYGSRAANGVILITTKSGKDSKASINVSSSYAVSTPTKKYEFMPDYPRALTLHQRAAAVNTLLGNQTFKDGTIDQWMALGMIDPLHYPNTDWWGLILRNGTIQNHNISASGSNDKSNFFVSVGIMDEEGLQINNDYTLYNIRSNYDYKILKNMDFGIRFNGNWSKFAYSWADGFTDNSSAIAGGGGQDILTAIAGITPYDPITGYYGGVMAYGESATAFNPYVVYMNTVNRQNRQEANTSLYWRWKPVKGLTAYVDYSLKYYNQFRYQADIPARSYNFQTNSFGPRIYFAENTPIVNTTHTGYKTQLTGRLDYQATIADNHDVSFLAAYSEEYWYDRYQLSSREDRLHPSLHEIDAALTDMQHTGGNSNTEGLRSYIGRFNYSAYEKYLAEINFRVDGSSRFLKGHQYGFFPSAAVAWRFTEESFVKSFIKQWWSHGKMRLSYGSLGNNSGVGRYEQQETLTTNNYTIDGAIVKGFTNNKMVNRNLTWETTSIFNIGLDLGFFNNKLTAELDYYDRLTTDMNRPSDLSILLTGAYNPPPRKNIGNLRNRGIEGNFIWRDNKGDFNYMINFNASYNKNRLEEWNEFLPKGYTFLDMPYHFVYAYEAIGIAQTWEDVYREVPQGAAPGDILIKDINGDGLIDANDKVAYPDIQRDRPTTNFALNTRFEWRNIDLSILFQGAAGRKDFWLTSYNTTNFATQRFASSWDHWNKPWSVENREGSWPRLAGGNKNRFESTFWLDSMDYIRLKNIQLGYSIPKQWIQKLHIENVRIYGSGENIFTITKFRGLDPERSIHAGDVYPLIRSFSIGLNISI